VRPEQRRATALALAPALLLGRADVERERQALRDVVWVALRFTPCVTEQAPHTVLMEVAASKRLFGGLDRLVARLCQALAPLGHRFRLACAPTAGGAALLALWAGWEGHQGEAEMQTPRFNLSRQPLSLPTLRAALDEVPLGLLCQEDSEWERLQGMGLQRLGDLRTLPRDGLARRFGPGLLRALADQP